MIFDSARTHPTQPDPRLTPRLLAACHSESSAPRRCASDDGNVARQVGCGPSRPTMAFLLATLALSAACGGAVVSDGGSGSGIVTAVDAEPASVEYGHTPPAAVALAALVVGTAISTPAVTWSLAPGAEGCGPLGASVTRTGIFTAPTSPDTYIGGTCQVIATAVADPTKSGVTTVTITAPTATPPATTPPPAGVVPAFVGAEGSAATSKGGRGGVVYEVTNLDDSGTGSLRACVEASGPRTCVFRVSGVINITRNYYITSPYLTVAGQTAPGDGVAINWNQHDSGNGMFYLFAGAHDVVLRYLRIWGDYTNNSSSTNVGTVAVKAVGGNHDLIVDHCTLLWHSWEPIDWFHETATAEDSARLTLSWNLIGESVLNAGTGVGPQAVGVQSHDSSFDGTQFRDVDLHHNVLATATHRMPGLNGSGRMVNNLMYNWQRATYVDSYGGPSTYDFIGNYFKPGLMSKASGYRELQMGRGASSGIYGSFYVSGNRSDWNLSGRGVVTGAESMDGQWSLLTAYTPVFQGSYATTGGAQPAPAAHRRDTALAAAGIPITASTASTLEARLFAPGAVGASRRLDCLGSWVNVSDSARDRILAYVAAGGGPSTVLASASAYNSGALPTIATGTPCADQDHDGIPDAYEQASCGTATCLDGGTVRSDGYTNLEHYLNGLPPG